MTLRSTTMSKTMRSWNDSCFENKELKPPTTSMVTKIHKSEETSEWFPKLIPGLEVLKHKETPTSNSEDELNKQGEQPRERMQAHLTRKGGTQSPRRRMPSKTSALSTMKSCAYEKSKPSNVQAQEYKSRDEPNRRHSTTTSAVTQFDV